jgi:hypothetical protein
LQDEEKAKGQEREALVAISLVIRLTFVMATIDRLNFLACGTWKKGCQIAAI